MDEEKKDGGNRELSFWETVKKYLKRIVEYLKVAKMEYIVMIALFAVDLISKAIINATIPVGDTVVLIPNFLQFTNVHNYAAAFGNDAIKNALGSIGSRILFSIFAVAASVVFIIILVRHKGGNRMFRVSLAMVTAGAMGNCIDRMFLGYVRDFIEIVYFGQTIKIGGYVATSFYIFNIADACLVIGVIMIVIYFIFMYKDKDTKKAAEIPADGSVAAEDNTSVKPETVAAESDKNQAENDKNQNASPPERDGGGTAEQKDSAEAQPTNIEDKNIEEARDGAIAVPTEDNIQEAAEEEIDSVKSDGGTESDKDNGVSAEEQPREVTEQETAAEAKAEAPKKRRRTVKKQVETDGEVK